MPEEKRVKVVAYRVRLVCDCGGEMKSTGVCMTSNPPQYPYVCKQCGYRQTVYTTYPRIEYVEE